MADAPSEPVIKARCIRLLLVEFMNPIEISIMKGEQKLSSNLAWDHAHYAIGWGDPRVRWKVLFKLPF